MSCVSCLAGQQTSTLAIRSLLDLLATTSFEACKPLEVKAAHSIEPLSQALQSFVSVFLLLNRESISAKTAEGSLVVTPGFGLPKNSGTLLMRNFGRAYESHAQLFLTRLVLRDRGVDRHVLARELGITP